MTRPTMPNAYPPGDLAAPPVDEELVDALVAAGISVDVTARARADHGRDWWPLLLRDVHEGRVPFWPAVVARPATTDDVVATLRVARERGVAVTAQGGRSGVVGGAAAPDGSIALDMTGMDRVVAVDEVAGTVRVEAGVFGPDLEAAVRERGFTVGHFPQSFDLSTVGGWLACRGAGQYSNRYGKVEDIVRGLRVVLASGEVVDLGGRGPRQAVGPDLVGLMVGSEGALGVITEATLVLRRVPQSEARAAYGFGSFAEGLDACRRVLQRDARPAVLRLYDQVESRRSFAQDTCVLIVLDEGDEAFVAATLGVVAAECGGADRLDDALVATWLAHRNDVGALAPLWEGGVVVDTLEVAAPWSALEPMRVTVVAALEALPDTIVASVHQSHAYVDGACLYFTFAGRPAGDPTPYYRAAWDAATREVLAAGGALSHHHGVGRNRARFLDAALGGGADVLRTLKEALDPDHLLNPGVLGLGGEAW